MADSFNSTESLNDSPAVEVTGKIMVVAIVILFMVVVFVLILHLYAKWFWWRIEEPTPPPPPPRRRRRRRFVFAPGQDPSINVPNQSGLDPSLLKSLPVLTFQPEDFKEGLECAVCLCELVEGEKARLLPKCNHGFHVDCIDMWFQSHSTCPICRNPVAPDSSKCNCSSSVRENASENSSSQSQAAENSASGSTMNVSESPNFPTNVLIWGNQTQVSSSGTSLEEEEEEGPSSSSTANSSSSSRHHEMLAIDIPSEANSSSLSPSGSRFAEDELKSPMTTRLRSLKRLLSRDKRLGPSSNPSSLDVEQAGRGQS